MTAAPLAAPRRGDTRTARPATTPLDRSRPGERAAEDGARCQREERCRAPGAGVGSPGVSGSVDRRVAGSIAQGLGIETRKDWPGSRLTNARSQSQTVAKRRRARRDELAIERLVEWIGLCRPSERRRSEISEARRAPHPVNPLTPLRLAVLSGPAQLLRSIPRHRMDRSSHAPTVPARSSGRKSCCPSSKSRKY
jgi:hypothetical protein